MWGDYKQHMYVIPQGFPKLACNTHVHQNGSESTIDLVYVAAGSMIKTCDTIPPLSNSDHQGILIELSIKPANCDKSQGHLIWRYSHADWNRTCELIEAYNWDVILSDNIKLSWKRWHCKFMCIMEQTVLNRLLTKRRNLPGPLYILQRKQMCGYHGNRM